MIRSDENVGWTLVTKGLSRKESCYDPRNIVTPKIQFILLWRKRGRFMLHKVLRLSKTPAGGRCQSVDYNYTASTTTSNNVQRVALWHFLCIVSYSRGLTHLYVSWFNFKTTLWNRFTTMIIMIPLLLPPGNKGNERLGNRGVGNTANQWERAEPTAPVLQPASVNTDGPATSVTIKQQICTHRGLALGTNTATLHKAAVLLRRQTWNK